MQDFRQLTLKEISQMEYDEIADEFDKEQGVDISSTVRVFQAFARREYDNNTAALLTLAHILKKKTA